MPRATCRCGQTLTLPRDGTDRIICSNCGAKIRIRRSQGESLVKGADDGFIRFACVCGRRLKVVSQGPRDTQAQCRCPDCGRVVDVPRESLMVDPEAPTGELSRDDMAQLEEWSRKYGVEDPLVPKSPSTVDIPPATAAQPPTSWKSEAGMRVCPQCGKPIHLGSEECTACGVAVPRR